MYTTVLYLYTLLIVILVLFMALSIYIMRFKILSYQRTLLSIFTQSLYKYVVESLKNLGLELRTRGIKQFFTLALLLRHRLCGSSIYKELLENGLGYDTNRVCSEKIVFPDISKHLFEAFYRIHRLVLEISIDMYYLSRGVINCRVEYCESIDSLGKALKCLNSIESSYLCIYNALEERNTIASNIAIHIEKLLRENIEKLISKPTQLHRELYSYIHRILEILNSYKFKELRLSKRVIYLIIFTYRLVEVLKNAIDEEIIGISKILNTRTLAPILRALDIKEFVYPCNAISKHISEAMTKCVDEYLQILEAKRIAFLYRDLYSTITEQLHKKGMVRIRDLPIDRDTANKVLKLFVELNPQYEFR